MMHAPVIPIAGVFFPVWIFCALFGAVCALVLRQVVIVINGQPSPYLGAGFYSAVWLGVTLVSYMFWIGGFDL